jgi:hypothetical protein
LESKSRTHNISLAKWWGGSCFLESEVLNPSFVHLMKFSAENPPLRKAQNRLPDILEQKT